jgi:hypothetical protein
VLLKLRNRDVSLDDLRVTVIATIGSTDLASAALEAQLFNAFTRRPKQDEVEMEAGGLGPEGPGACLERRSGAPRCPREPVRLQDPVIPDLVSALTLQTE